MGMLIENASIQCHKSLKLLSCQLEQVSVANTLLTEIFNMNNFVPDEMLGKSGPHILIEQDSQLGRLCKKSLQPIWGKLQNRLCFV